jgi:hypothetical protein
MGKSDSKNSEPEEKVNIASFVRKTKELLLNQEVLKEVETATPGDQVSYCSFIIFLFIRFFVNKE